MWLHNLWFNYFWSSLKGNGPEALVQTVLYGLIALAVVPPFRHWFERHVKSIHDKLDAHHEEVLRQGERHHVGAMNQAKRHHEEHMAALKGTSPKRGANGRFTKGTP